MTKKIQIHFLQAERCLLFIQIGKSADISTVAMCRSQNIQGIHFYSSVINIRRNDVTIKVECFHHSTMPQQEVYNGKFRHKFA